MVFSPISRIISYAASSASQRPLFTLLKRATARKATGSRFSILFQNLSVSPSLSFLRVSPKAQSLAFKSLHLLLSPNTEYGGQGRIVLATINNNPSTPPCLRASFFSVFRRRLKRQRQKKHIGLSSYEY